MLVERFRARGGTRTVSERVDGKAARRRQAEDEGPLGRARRKVGHPGDENTARSIKRDQLGSAVIWASTTGRRTHGPAAQERYSM